MNNDEYQIFKMFNNATAVEADALPGPAPRMYIGSGEDVDLEWMNEHRFPVEEQTFPENI